MIKNISNNRYTIFGSTGFLGKNFKKYLKKKKLLCFMSIKKKI